MAIHRTQLFSTLLEDYQRGDILCADGVAKRTTVRARWHGSGVVAPTDASVPGRCVCTRAPRVPQTEKSWNDQASQSCRDRKEEPCGTQLLNPLTCSVGEWTLTLTDAWFLESRDVRQQGRAIARRLGGAFIELEAEMEGEHVWHFVLGHGDANEQLIALYHDPGQRLALTT
jgi:hypothetical protein